MRTGMAVAGLASILVMSRGAAPAEEIPAGVASSAVAAVKKLGEQVVLGNRMYAVERMYPRWKERMAKRMGGMEVLERKLKEQIRNVDEQMRLHGMSMISFKPVGVPSVHGVWPGKQIKAVIPGGTSVPVLKGDELDVPADFESLAQAGTMLGSGAMIVMDETTCMVEALANILRFYAHESCGQCTPCREGTRWASRLMWKLRDGELDVSTIDLLLDISDNMAFKTICPLADAAAMPMKGFVTKFRADFEEHVRLGRCPMG